MDSVKVSLADSSTSAILAELKQVNAEYRQCYPGAGSARQPLHTMYGGAHLFADDTMAKIGSRAQEALAIYGSDFVVFARALGLPGCDQLASGSGWVDEIGVLLRQDGDGLRVDKPAAWLAATVYERVVGKLAVEPVEDYRIDFEDGYGVRCDREEDHHAAASAAALARVADTAKMSPFCGIRVKAFSDESVQRSIRTLDIFLTELVVARGGSLPKNFVVTLPKPVAGGQVDAFVRILAALEAKLGLAAQSLKIELMIETPQSIINNKGEVAVAQLVAAASGRCKAVHFGAYDYTAACDVAGAYQTLDHPHCDYARSVMKAALAGTGIELCDGATTVIPVGSSPGKNTGAALSSRQALANQQSVHNAWALSCRNIEHALQQGFYQGWDLHPAQLPVRYAASYAFFLKNWQGAAQRFKAFMDKAGQATLLGASFDDAATGQGLLNFFLRGLNCGAFAPGDLLPLELTLEELQTRSLVKILQARRKN